ncbi:MAG TPA: Sir2 family NAD-dependent protein deacetylase [Candidatus Lokiarchaeia archaeon]|nr:Sir2 family NAD-dependent protein deacetylase [Candidatus Lokiarchaeia archaeon]
MSSVLEEQLNTIAQWIAEAQTVVALTGAGISTESGIPDYRGPEGVWTRRDKGLPPPPMKVPWEDIQPNAGHFALVELMNLGKLDFLISQNVDGLHLQSGIPVEKIAELHGNHHLWHCLNCNAKYTKDEIGWDERKWGRGYLTEKVRPGMPTCPQCSGVIRSSIVNFGDPLPQLDFAKAVTFSKKADVFLSIGTSLQVTPAADLPNYALRHGAKFVLINQGKTPFDGRADIRIWDAIGDVLPPVVEKVKILIEK